MILLPTSYYYRAIVSLSLKQIRKVPISAELRKEVAAADCRFKNLTDCTMNYIIRKITLELICLHGWNEKL